MSEESVCVIADCCEECENIFTVSADDIIYENQDDDLSFERIIALQIINCNDQLEVLWGIDPNPICTQDVLIVDEPDCNDIDDYCTMTELVNIAQSVLDNICSGATIISSPDGSSWTLDLSQTNCNYKGLRITGDNIELNSTDCNDQTNLDMASFDLILECNCNN